MSLKVILLGTGGWGEVWCRVTLPQAVNEGLVEVVAAVDINSSNLGNARKFLELKDEQCFLDAKTAFSIVKAEACIIAVPPEFHEEMVNLAIENNCHILSEKPISDSLDASIRIMKRVDGAGIKMGITMSHKYRQDIYTLREVICSRKFGALDYLICNFNWNRRDGLNERQANMPNTMLIEGAVHHLDILEDLSGSKCKTIYADTWTPAWGNYKGSSQGLIIMKFHNGVRASYETSWCNASCENQWGKEYIRAEFEKATVVLNKGKIHYIKYNSEVKAPQNETEVELKTKPKWSNNYLLEEFVNWVNGGEPMETNINSTIRTMFLVFAAIRSSETCMPIDVDLLMKEYEL